MSDATGRVEFAEVASVNGDRSVRLDHSPGEMDLAVVLVGFARRLDFRPGLGLTEADMSVECGPPGRHAPVGSS